MHWNLGSDKCLVWPVWMSNFLMLSVLLLFSLPAVAQQGSVHSSLSESTITRDESVTLTIMSVGLDGELDASALDEHFEVLSTSTSQQIRTVRGVNKQPVTARITTWDLEILPRKVGVFTVPSVTVNGVSSPLLTLTVNEAPSGAKRDIFVEATVDSRSPWVQSQVLMTVRVFQAIEIVDGGLSDPEGDDLQVQRIGKDVYSSEVRDGREYRVTERQFALFPQKSGTVSIEPVRLTVSVPVSSSSSNNSRGPFSRSTRRLTRSSDAIVLDVQARPSSGAFWWLPANAMQLDGDWVGGTADAAVGQALTRTIVLRAGGVLDSQLPDIPVPEVDGVSLYAEEPVRNMGVNDLGLVAEQTLKWALIPQREGELVLPAISVDWFNTRTGKMEVATLAEETIFVGPSSTFAQATPSVSNDASAIPRTGETQGEEVASAETILAPDNVPTSAESLQGTDNETSAPAAPALREQIEALSTQVAQLQQSNTWWRLLAVSLIALVLFAFVSLWLYRRKQRRELFGEGRPSGLGAVRRRVTETYRVLAPLVAVDAACKGASTTAVRQSLIEWAARQWPDHSPQTLSDVSARLSQGEARELILALDASLYSRAQSPEDSQLLMKRLSALPASLEKAVSDKEHSVGLKAGNASVNAEKTRGRTLPSL